MEMINSSGMSELLHGQDNQSLFSNDTGNQSESSSQSTIALAPFLMLELVASIVSNIILMALIIKARKVNNNTNVYLFSLTIFGLLESFNIFCLAVSVIVGRWVFGSLVCFVNEFILTSTLPAVLSFHVAISRDRYKAIQNPLNYWCNKSKRQYIVTTCIWVSSAVIALFHTIWFAVESDSGDPKFPICKSGFDIVNKASHQRNIVRAIILSIFYLIFIGAISVTTLGHYFVVLRELHMLQKLRSQYRKESGSSEVLVTGYDKPLHGMVEGRAAKSLATMFVFQLTCSVTAILVGIVFIFRSSDSEDDNQNSSFDVSSELEVVLLLFFYFLPALGPMVLILTNQRFRNRVINLLKCESELKPDTEYPVHNHESTQLPITRKLKLSLRQNLPSTAKMSAYKCETPNQVAVDVSTGIESERSAVERRLRKHQARSKLRTIVESANEQAWDAI